MLNRCLLYGLSWLLFSPVCAQFTDNFSDGNFTANPVWIGDDSLFEVDANFKLHLNDNVTREAHLSTLSAAINNASWEFLVELDFNPSSSNRARVYLVSDAPDLEGSLNGYFVQLGNTEDEISLYVQSGTSTTEIIDGTDDKLDVSSSSVRVRVTRDNLGNWTLESDTSGGTNYVQEGTVNNTDHVQSTWFGVWCDYTSTRADLMFFDDFNVTGTGFQDTIPPTVTALNVLSEDSLEVTFSEFVNQATAQNTANYSVNNGIGNPAQAIRNNSDSTKVILVFANPFPNCTSNILTISNVQDVAGNPLTAPATQTFSYTVSGTPFLKAVIINEIFPDPDTILTSMPGAEFIELYNRSSTAFDLNGWVFSDAASSVTLGSYALCPGEYVILTKNADVSKFTGFGPVLGLSNLPSLNNSGDEIGLRAPNGTLVDTVEYDNDWYGDPIKDDGGYTLELINPEDTCSFVGNWIGSNAAIGGTPGTQNSVFDNTPDITAPQLLSITVTGPTSLQICFDETMDAATLAGVTNYSINNGLGTPATASPIGPAFSCVDLTLSSNIDTGTVYTIQFSNITDCKGNSVGLLNGTFVLGGSGVAGDIIITELFPDPSPVIGLPEAEFIEILNVSNKVIDLNNWELGDKGSSNASLGSYSIFPGDYLILCANGDTALYSNQGNVLGVSSIPSLNNSTDSLELYNAQGELVDFVYYADSWYQDEVKADGGYTLERIDTGFTCLNEGNWRASNDVSGGTPGRVNSINGTFSDAEAPRITRSVLINPTILRIYFNEVMDEATLTNTANYSIDQGVGNPIAVSPASSPAFAVDLLIPQLDTNIVYCVTVTGLTDCPGNVIGNENQACFGIPLFPEPGDLIINEILFNPYTGGSDFVELYNTSNKVLDLRDLNIGEIVEGTDSIFNSDPVSSESFLVLPQSYVCLTKDKDFQIQTYNPIDPDAIFEMSDFPSYDDGDGECVIFSDSGTVLDRFYYEDDYHFPNLDDDNGVSLERLSFTNPTQDPANWHSAASIVNYATPGYENSQQLDQSGEDAEVWLSPTTFSPDQDGQDDLLFINYRFNFPGQNARAVVYDRLGRYVATIQQNTLLATGEGNLTWDGTDENGNKADVGVYVILFEISNPNNGETKKYKLGAVLAARFD